jgi:ABC-type glycerol-3-phosphate transport system substrate-binding protein
MVSSRTPRFGRRDFFRLAAAAGGAVALPGLLSACGSGPAAPPIESGAVDLAFWTHDKGYIDFFTAAVPLADARTQFDYTLTITKIGATDLVTKMIAQAVTGTGTPDVVGLEVGSFARTLRGDIAAELLVDLTAATAPYAGDLIRARMDPYSKDGRLYALDSDTPLTIYYYRQDEFDRLGVPHDIETWEELARVGAAVSAANDGVAFGALAVGSDLPQVVQGYQLLLMQRGGTIFNAHGELDIETPEAEEALRFAVDGLRSGFFTAVAAARPQHPLRLGEPLVRPGARRLGAGIGADDPCLPDPPQAAPRGPRHRRGQGLNPQSWNTAERTPCST